MNQAQRYDFSADDDPLASEGRNAKDDAKWLPAPARTPMNDRLVQDLSRRRAAEAA